jgi:Tfp pilus assembly protein PilF
MGLAAALLRRRRELFPLWGFVLLYMLSVIAFFVTARYRLPVVPVLLLLGAYGIGEAWAALRSKAWKSVAILGVALGCGSVLAVSSPTVSSQAEEWATVDLAKVLAQQGRGNEAVDLLEDARRTNPSSSQILFALGVAHQSVNRPEEAFGAYSEAISLDPQNVPAHNNLATLLMQANRLEEAIGVLQAAVRADPYHSGAWFNLGRAFAATGRNADAVACFTQGLQIQPDRIDVLVQLAASQARTGDFREATATIDKAIGVAARHNDAGMIARLRRLQELYRAGRLEEPGGPGR